MSENSNLPKHSTVPVFFVDNSLDHPPEIHVMVNEVARSSERSFEEMPTTASSTSLPSYGECCVGESSAAIRSQMGSQPINVVINNSNYLLRAFHGFPEECVEDFFRDFECYFRTTKLQDSQQLDRLVSSLMGPAKRCFWAN